VLTHLRSLIPTKKEFWLSDDAVAPQNLESYLRGEKPDVSHAVVAWASQTGKGLLFINKKGETERTRPADVLALYDATDLKKQSPHEFSLRINGAAHTFKATSDAERDGWYLAVEKSIELGKASKEEIRESEGYKAELEKLSKWLQGVINVHASRANDPQTNQPFPPALPPVAFPSQRRVSRFLPNSELDHLTGRPRMARRRRADLPLAVSSTD
jgi:hypothetical protein